MSTNHRVVGAVYVFDPVPLDQTAPHLRRVEPGLYVRVINLRGCPPANAMGHAYVEAAVTNEFIGLVCCNSLRPLSPAERRKLVEQGTIVVRSRSRAVSPNRA